MRDGVRRGREGEWRRGSNALRRATPPEGRSAAAGKCILRQNTVAKADGGGDCGGDGNRIIPREGELNPGKKSK